ncbi:MAG: DnaJ domain-containing protein [Acidimicrobiia bacterium]|nr:DnaJ domain-containing protein [Acidimicrobiia bacterium]
MQNDLYAVLGVPSNAGDAEIKAAYRKLAREHHPDARPGDSEAEARFKEISTAYAVLGDPEKRRRYDTFGPDAFRAGGGGSG